MQNLIYNFKIRNIKIYYNIILLYCIACVYSKARRIILLYYTILLLFNRTDDP